MGFNKKNINLELLIHFKQKIQKFKIQKRIWFINKIVYNIVQLNQFHCFIQYQLNWTKR